MLKRIALFAVVGMIVLSCGQVSEQSSDVTQMNQISELVSEPLGFDEQEVSFEGTITHICRHSGDKMRVNQLDDADFSIMVMLNEFQTQINPDFEGRQVKVDGLLKTQVRNMEEIEDHQDHEHEGEEGHDCASTQEAVKRLEERGVTPDVIAYVEMQSFEILETMESETSQQEDTDGEEDQTIEVADVE